MAGMEHRRRRLRGEFSKLFGFSRSFNVSSAKPQCAAAVISTVNNEPGKYYKVFYI
jgi:hypothetical protein